MQQGTGLVRNRILIKKLPSAYESAGIPPVNHARHPADTMMHQEHADPVCPDVFQASQQKQERGYVPAYSLLTVSPYPVEDMGSGSDGSKKTTHAMISAQPFNHPHITLDHPAQNKQDFDCRHHKR